MTIDKNWDKKLNDLGGHFLQSKVNLEFHESLGKTVLTKSTKDFMWGGYVVNGRLGFKYLYIPYGPTLQDPKYLKPAIDSIKRAAKEQGCIFARFDQNFESPAIVLKKFGCKFFGEVQPAITHVIDLEKELSLYKGQMSKANRNLINRSEKIGITYKKSASQKDIESFLNLMFDTAKYKKYRSFSRNYTKNQIRFYLDKKVANIFSASVDDQKVAMVIGVDWGKTRYYLYAGADQSVIRKIPASRGLAWHMINDAKEKRLAVFDFYGVAPADLPSHKWASVSSFKRSFCGVDKIFGGTWDIPASRSRYAYYRSLKKATRFL